MAVDPVTVTHPLGLSVRSAKEAAATKERQKVEVMSQTVKILEREKEFMKAEMSDELASEKHMVLRLEDLLKTLQGAAKTSQVETQDQNEELTKALEDAEDVIDKLTQEKEDLENEMEQMVQHVHSMEASFASQQAEAVTST